VSPPVYKNAQTYLAAVKKINSVMRARRVYVILAAIKTTRPQSGAPHKEGLYIVVYN